VDPNIHWVQPAFLLKEHILAEQVYGQCAKWQGRVICQKVHRTPSLRLADQKDSTEDQVIHSTENEKTFILPTKAMTGTDKSFCKGNEYCKNTFDSNFK
jgi:hypothetical protein